MLKKPKYDKCWQKRAKRRPIKNFNSQKEKVNKTLIKFLKNWQNLDWKLLKAGILNEK